MKTYTKFAPIFCLLLVIGLVITTVSAKSVYTIARHEASAVRVYTIDGDQLIHEEEYNGGFPNNGYGAIDLALDYEDDVLFASYDGANVIEMINSKTMEYIGSKPVTEEMAGLTFYQSRRWLLAAQRELFGDPDPTLFVYYYDPEEQSLTQIHTHLLEELTGGALGICLDEMDMRLYVTDNSSNVYYYDMTIQNNLPVFTYAGYIEIELDSESKDAVGVAVYNDGQGTKYLYTAGYNHTGHSYVIRTDIAGPGSSLGAYMGGGTMAAGVAINEDTGLLYVTTLGIQSSLRVYTPLNWTSDPCDCQPTQVITEGFYGPAGVIVGSQYKSSHRITLEKTQTDPNVNVCVSPDDYITYEICYYNGPESETNVVLMDTLPLGATFIDADPYPDDWDSLENTYTWYLADMDPNESIQCIELIVQVNEWAEPAGELVNIAEIESDEAYARAEAHTPVCCWDSDIIYVDIHAIGAETGVDWDNAYRSLKDALARAALGCGAEIWVARGVYSPGDSTSDSFIIPDGVEVYGGFNGTETLREQRDFIHNKTILSGYIDGVDNNQKIVTMNDDSVLDGFIIRDADQYGIYSIITDATFSITNCIVEENAEWGIYCLNGNPTLMWCIIQNNGFDGIYAVGSNRTIFIANCKIHGNNRSGIFCQYSTPTILNSMVAANGSDGVDYYGIRLYQPWSSPIIRNNTLVLNHNEGIYRTGGQAPTITGCILWANNDNGDQYSNCTFTYSCLLDPNYPAGDAPGSDTPDPVTHNITAWPSFVYDDPNSGHLRPDSPCIDIGYNYTGSASDTDIDGDSRVIDGDGDYTDEIDMGCDEVACADVEHEWDFSKDGIINLREFALFSAAWLKDSNDQDWATYSQCDFDSDDDVDLDDLCLFAEEWLWQACWRNPESMMMMAMGGSGGAGLSPAQYSAVELEAAKFARWRAIQPAFEPSPQYLLWLMDDLIAWTEDLWDVDADLRSEITEEEFAEFLKQLYAYRDELLDELAQKYESAP